jgi:hypothetical protein
VSVQTAVKAEIDALGKLPPAAFGAAAAAMALAAEIDSEHNSATSKSMCARELRETLGHLRDLIPTVPADDKLDKLSKARAARRAR